MAVFTFQYYSKALNCQTALNVILPEVPKYDEGVGNPGTPYKTLYLLHGLSGDHTSWMHRSSIERYANRHRVAVVMPNVGRSWYTDTAYGENYMTFVSTELPQVCRGYFHGMSDKKEDNYIGGLSMGGYGALKIALTYPDRYAGCISLSGSVDITRKGRTVDLPLWRAIFGFDLQSADQLAGTEHDIYALVSKNHAAGLPFPKLYIWCGTEDSLLPANERLHQQLESLGIDHYYETSEDTHQFQWWDLHIQGGMKYMFG